MGVSFFGEDDMRESESVQDAMPESMQNPDSFQAEGREGTAGGVWGIFIVGKG